jgi:hypothetical protein
VICEKHANNFILFIKNGELKGEVKIGRLGGPQASETRPALHGAEQAGH